MLKEYLNQPYPLFGDRWKLVIFISLFIGLFMLVFQPFGVVALRGVHNDLVLAGYGLVSFTILTIDYFIVQLIFKRWFNRSSWNVLKQILWIIFIIFSIGVGNFLYSAIVFSLWSWRLFFSLMVYTLLVGIIPIVGLTIIKQNLLLSRNLKMADEFNRDLKPGEVSSGENIVRLGNDNDNIEIELINLLYLESAGNYIKVFYLKDNKQESNILRCTLKHAEFQMEDFQNLVRCHRAFIVNLDKVVRAKGNSQGLRLVLDGTETEIPVSRNFSKGIKKSFIRT